MTVSTFHGIGENGKLLPGALTEFRGTWVLQLEDGSERGFGVVSDYSRTAIQQIKYPAPFPLDSNPVDASLRSVVTASSVILEITPFCSAGCTTCIASSIKTRVGELISEEFEQRLSALHASTIVPADTSVMISGGEPTEHPDFLALVSSPAFLKFRSRFVITYGLEFTRLDFARRFAEVSPGTQLYLQYDSFDANHLHMIRGRDLTHIREGAIRNCEEAGIDYTLICVILRGVNDGSMPEIIERNLNNPHCVGVTLQPIKFVGRGETVRPEHRIPTFDIVAHLDERLQRSVGIRLVPHPANPLNWAIGYADGHMPTQPTLYDVNRTKRVAVVWHTDSENYVLESVGAHPIGFVEANGIVPLEVHYGGV